MVRITIFESEFIIPLNGYIKTEKGSSFLVYPNEHPRLCALLLDTPVENIKLYFGNN